MFWESEKIQTDMIIRIFLQELRIGCDVGLERMIEERMEECQ